MSYIWPSFCPNAPNKVSTRITVCDKHRLVKNVGPSRLAIAEEWFDAKVDGTKLFCVRFDHATLSVGFTPLETCVDSVPVNFGVNGLIGCGLDLYNGVLLYPVNQSHEIISDVISEKATEIIVILTISNNGAKKEIRFLLNGNESKSTDVSEHLKGDRLFPAICLNYPSQQVTTIPIDQIKTRTPEIENFIKEYQQQNQNSNNQNVAVASALSSAPFSAALLQLQNDLNQARQEISALALQRQQEKQQHEAKVNQVEKQLQQEKQQHEAHIKKAKENVDELFQEKMKSLQLEKDVQRLQLLLAAALSSPPFVDGKFYQIDYVINGLPQPGLRPALHLAPATSRIFSEAEALLKTAGGFIPDPKLPTGFVRRPIQGYKLRELQVIVRNVAVFEDRFDILADFRAKNDAVLANLTTGFSAEQMKVLDTLRADFLPRPANADPESPNLVNVFHGTKPEFVESASRTIRSTGSTDAGFFGKGVYTTTSIEYAATYAQPRAVDGCVPVLWCVAAIGVCYPLTREKDYSKNRKEKLFGHQNETHVSDFFGLPLNREGATYDCHCAVVHSSAGYQAVPHQNKEFMEVVIEQESQILPIAVLWLNQ